MKNSVITVYHGSYCKVSEPDIKRGDVDTDFGQSFYVTTSLQMAKAWAARKEKASIISQYTFDVQDLTVITFNQDEQWLRFVMGNRQNNPELQREVIRQNPDMIIGPTADDTMYSVLDYFENGFINGELAAELLNKMKVGQQIAIKSQKAIDRLCYQGYYALSPKEKQEILHDTKTRKTKVDEMVAEELKKHNQTAKEFTMPSLQNAIQIPDAVWDLVAEDKDTDLTDDFER